MKIKIKPVGGDCKLSIDTCKVLYGYEEFQMLVLEKRFLKNLHNFVVLVPRWSPDIISTSFVPV